MHGRNNSDLIGIGNYLGNKEANENKKIDKSIKKRKKQIKAFPFV